MTGTRDKICACDAKADADEDALGGKALAEVEAIDGPFPTFCGGRARDCAGSRDSTTARSASQSIQVQPSNHRVASLGQTHVCAAAGVAKIYEAR